ncbi:MAG TPA: aminoglycoside phosphotransferase family protein [Solirubrobacteraceae bacterium]|nr:aminoglycoside phosphotransferase family protein [Solirubrobacteraceae bacterium]
MTDGRGGAIRIPPRLANAVVEDGREHPDRPVWLAGLPAQVSAIVSEWELELGDPYLPGGQCAWVAPARTRAGDELVLKLSWRHREAEHEAEGLLHWAGDGTVRCLAAAHLDGTDALLLERCVPGQALGSSLPEPEQDEIIVGLLRRLHARELPPDHPFRSLEDTCQAWADAFELAYAQDRHGLDPGPARQGVEILRTLPATAPTRVLLSTDLHAENVLSSQREPWLLIDPKPMVGDPAFDPIQHMLNCEHRLRSDPFGLARRMAELLGHDPERVRLWLLARCVQESLDSLGAREIARRLVL